MVNFRPSCDSTPDCHRSVHPDVFVKSPLLILIPLQFQYMLYPRSLPRFPNSTHSSYSSCEKGREKKERREKLFMLSLYLHRQTTNICCHAFQSRPISNTPYPQKVAQYVLFFKKSNLFSASFFRGKEGRRPSSSSLFSSSLLAPVSFTRAQNFS